MSRFRVGLTADFYDAAGNCKYADIGLDRLAAAKEIEVGRLAEHRPELTADQVAAWNGLIVLTPRVTLASLASPGDLLALARFGVGYDSVDVAACTAADVLLTITVGAVDHSVAEATVGWMLALSHHMRSKDRLVRDATWEIRSQFMGSELRGRTLGIIGMGGIGRAVIQMLSGFQMEQPLVFDPFVSAETIAQAGARQCSLEELLTKSDFVSLHCPLNDSTRGLIAQRELRLMKPTAYLINTARGGIIDDDSLYQALASRQIAGAAIDCFVGEPLTSPPKIASLENVLLAPHCIAWTDELFRDIGRAACQTMIDLAAGRRPKGAVNPQVFESPGFQEKWRRLRATG